MRTWGIVLLALLLAPATARAVGREVPQAPASDQAPGSSDAAPVAEAPAPDRLAAVRGEARERAAGVRVGRGLASVVELAEAGRTELALALVEELAAEGREARYRDSDRAALQAARGWLEVELTPQLLAVDQPLPEPLGQRFEQVREAFIEARGAAGAGALRRFACGWLAALELFEAERAFRAFLSELEAGGAAAAAPAGASAPPDPRERIATLRAEFIESRDFSIECLQLDPREESTRANLEFCMRRLRELEDLERRIEEQQQEQEQQDQQQGDQDQQQSDPSEDGQDSESESSEDPSGEQEPPESEPADEGDESDENGEQPEPSEEEQGEEQQQPAPEAPSETEQNEQNEAAGAAEDEQAMSEEEITALLDRLAELEERAAQLRAARQQARRKAVERDW